MSAQIETALAVASIATMPTEPAPARQPGEVTIERPFPGYAIPRIFAWREALPSKIADDFSPRTVHRFVENWERQERAGRESWAVYRGGELGGAIVAQPLTPVVSQVSCIFKPSFWKGEIPFAALRMALVEIFDSGALKVTSAFFSNTHAMRSLVSQLGGQTEAVLKKHTFRDGQLADVVLIGITKEKFHG